MAMTASGFGRGIVIALLLSVVVGGLAYRYLGIGFGDDGDSPAALANQATKALEAVKNRDLKATLRPATYDAIMAPLDKLLLFAKNLQRSDSYDPVGDYETIRSYVEPVVEIAQLAHEQAQSESSFLRKDYRFMEQKGEACQYLAAATWNRLEAIHRQAGMKKQINEKFLPSATDSERMYSIINAGIEADPGNKFLWYLRSVVERVNGTFGAAAEDLQKALDIDPDFVAGWNDLGLTMINLRRFDKAEEAFEKAKAKAAEAANRAGVKPGAEYRAALFNLARFHEGLASYFNSASRTDPTPENKASLRKHADSARNYLQEFISLEPPDSPDLREAKTMLQGLP